VRRLMHGDHSAFEGLLEKYRRPILNCARRMLGDPTEAEDMAQNVFLQAFRACGRFRFQARFSSWLHAIARNLCVNELRRRARAAAVAFDDTSRDRGAGCSGQPGAPRSDRPPEAILHTELQEKIDEALCALPERQRAAMLLLRDQEMSYAQIATVLGTSLCATRAIIHRGRQALKRRLGPYLRTGAWP